MPKAQQRESVGQTGGGGDGPSIPSTASQLSIIRKQRLIVYALQVVQESDKQEWLGLLDPPGQGGHPPVHHLRTPCTDGQREAAELSLLLGLPEAALGGAPGAACEAAQEGTGYAPPPHPPFPTLPLSPPPYFPSLNTSTIPLLQGSFGLRLKGM